MTSSFGPVIIGFERSSDHISVGCELSALHFRSFQINNSFANPKNNLVLSLYLRGDVRWLDLKWIVLSSGIEIGCKLIEAGEANKADSKFFPELQLNVISLRAGGRFGVLGEFGFGNRGILHAGAFYNF